MIKKVLLSSALLSTTLFSDTINDNLYKVMELSKSNKIRAYNNKSNIIEVKTKLMSLSTLLKDLALLVDKKNKQNSEEFEKTQSEIKEISKLYVNNKVVIEEVNRELHVLTDKFERNKKSDHLNISKNERNIDKIYVKITDIYKTLSKHKKELEALIKNRVEMLNTRIDKEVTTLNTRIDKEVATLNKLIADLKKESEENFEIVHQTFTNETTSLNEKIVKTKSMLKTLINEKEKKLNETVLSKEQTLYAKIEKTEKELQTNIEKNRALILENKADADNELKEVIQVKNKEIALLNEKVLKLEERVKSVETFDFTLSKKESEIKNKELKKMESDLSSLKALYEEN